MTIKRGRPAIPSPLGVTDPVVLKSLVAIREAIDYLGRELEALERTINKPPPQIDVAGRRGPSFSPDNCGND